MHQTAVKKRCRLWGREDLIADPKYATNQQRMKHQPELNAIVAAWIGARPAGDVIRELSEAGVSVAPVYSNREVLNDPHVKARESVVRVADPDFGSVAVPCVVPRLSATPGSANTSGPAPGAHNADIYGGWLGLSEAEQSELRNNGVI